jgi:hypothetical protein
MKAFLLGFQIQWLISPLFDNLLNFANFQCLTAKSNQKGWLHAKQFIVPKGRIRQWTVKYKQMEEKLYITVKATNHRSSDTLTIKGLRCP